MQKSDERDMPSPKIWIVERRKASGLVASDPMQPHAQRCAAAPWRPESGALRHAGAGMNSAWTKLHGSLALIRRYELFQVFAWSRIQWDRGQDPP
jgi:hypothetical protein